MHGTIELHVDPVVHARRWKTLGVLCLSLMIVMVGNSSLNLALPELARDLGASNSALQWIVDVYALVFAGLLFPAGAIGDRIGRKRVLQAGLFVFLLAAVLGALASSSSALIAARAVMGVAAAFIMPSTLSILTNVFPPEERGRAIGLWAGIAAGGGAFGPVGAGLLLTHFGWGSVFLMNVPVVVAAIVLGRALVPESRDHEDRPIDVPGVALSLAGVSSLVYAIIQAPEHGWTSGRTAVTFGVAVVALVLFVARERSAAHPMLDLALFRDRRFSVGSIGIALAFFAMFGTWFLVAQHVQLALGWSPLGAGLLLSPFALIMMALAPRAPSLVARFGSSNVAASGLSLIAVGMFAFTTLDVDDPAVVLWVALFPMAVGMSITGTPLTTLIMSSVPGNRAGVGSAMNDTNRELGGALGVAVLGSIVTSRFASAVEPAVGGLTDDARDVAITGLPGALSVAERIGGPAGDALAVASKVAFIDAMHVAGVVAAVVVLAAAAATKALLRPPVTAFGEVMVEPQAHVRPDDRMSVS